MIIKTQDNKMYMYGIIWDGDDQAFDYYFTALESKYTDINIRLHTKGGNVIAGSFIESRIRQSKSKVVLTIDGAAFSMGGILMTAAAEREIVSNGFVMIHAPKGSTNGTAKDHRTSAQVLEDMELNFITSLLSITGKPEKEVKKWLESDTYFNAQRALKEGLVDRIVAPVVTNVKIDESTALDETDIFGRFSALLVEPEKRNIAQNQNSILSDQMKKQLIDKFGLQSVTAESSDTAVIEALEAHFAGKLNSVEAKLTEANSKISKFETTMTAQRDAKIEALLSPFTGKLNKEKIEAYRNIGKTTGVEALETILEGISPRQTITGQVQSHGATGAASKEDWDWDKYQKEDPRGLEKMAKENPESFVALGKEKFGDNWTY